MNKLKIILCIGIVFVSFGCQNLQPKPLQNSLSKEANNVEIATKEINRKISLKNWELTIASIKYAGQKFQGEYKSYEAADVWTVISVDIKNISEKRQRDDDTPFSFLFSNIVDYNGNKYNLKETEYKYSSDLFDKPFSPGESRTVELLFDTPQGIKLEKFLLHTFDNEPISIQFENQ